MRFNARKEENLKGKVTSYFTHFRSDECNGIVTAETTPD